MLRNYLAIYSENRRGSPCGCPNSVGDRKGRPYGTNEVKGMARRARFTTAKLVI
jgi:hypothetical protein